MKKTYSGSCHCGAIRFTAALDISRGTTKCNCTICARNRLWSAEAGPGEVRLLEGEDHLTDYTYNDRVAHHYFCQTCGVHPYEFVDLPLQNRSYYNVSINCLDDVDMAEVFAAPLEYVDGLHDRWDRVPAEVRHL